MVAAAFNKLLDGRGGGGGGDVGDAGGGGVLNQAAAAAGARYANDAAYDKMDDDDDDAGGADGGGGEADVEAAKAVAADEVEEAKSAYECELEVSSSRDPVEDRPSETAQEREEDAMEDATEDTMSSLGGGGVKDEGEDLAYLEAECSRLGVEIKRVKGKAWARLHRQRVAIRRRIGVLEMDRDGIDPGLYALFTSRSSDWGQRPGGASRITKNIYLGNAVDAVDLVQLAKIGVAAIVNVAALQLPGRDADFYANLVTLQGEEGGEDEEEGGGEGGGEEGGRRRMQVLEVPAQDDPEYALFSHFDACVAFLDEVEKRGQRVLIHCQSGRSRSAAITVAYLMIQHRMPLLEAYRKVFTGRDIICPNEGFMGQLVDLELSLFGELSQKRVFWNKVARG